MMTQGTTGVVFPGQGSQKKGMGKDFYDQVLSSRQTYEEASEVLGWDVPAMCFEDDDRLNLTAFAQPCILATEVAMYRGIQELYEFKADFYGGHSLGEYTALVAAGAIPLATALKIVEARGQLMQEAVAPGKGAMTAIIAKDLDVEAVIKALTGLPIDVANINSSDQVVISGLSESMNIASRRIAKTLNGGQDMRFVPLNVSAPFHSRFMNAIKDRFRELLRTISENFRPVFAGRVTSNYTGRFHDGSGASLIDALVSQLSGSVRWRDNMEILSENATQIYEIGPNRPLRSFFRTIDIQCRSITTFSTAKREFAS